MTQVNTVNTSQDAERSRGSPNYAIIVEQIILISIPLERLECVTDAINHSPSRPTNSLSVQSKNVGSWAKARHTHQSAVKLSPVEVGLIHNTKYIQGLRPARFPRLVHPCFRVIRPLFPCSIVGVG